MNRRAKRLRRAGNALLAFLLGLAALPFVKLAPSLISNFKSERETWGAAADVFEATVVTISAVIAYFAYKSAMQTVARQNTLHRLFEDHSDREVVEQRKLFRAIKASPDDKLSNYKTSKERVAFVERCKGSDPTYKTASAEEKHKFELKWKETFENRQSALFGVLNRYETFAIGISEGAIDEPLYRRWWRSSLIDDWHSVRETVAAMRIDYKSPLLFIEFERLANRWDKERAQDTSTE